MCLNNTPDLVLHRIFSYCVAKDIWSLQFVNRRLFEHITKYRLHYSKKYVARLEVEIKQNGEREVKVLDNDWIWIVVPGLMSNSVRSVHPYSIRSYDHDELANMSPIWWKDRKIIDLYDIVDYRRYLPNFDRCKILELESNFPKNLSEILQSMETKNLQIFSLKSDGELECTDDDLRKIAKISNKMEFLVLDNASQSSNISSDGVLDMLEMGSFAKFTIICISKIANFESIEERLRQLKWVARCDRFDERCLKIKTTDGSHYEVTTN